MQKVYAAADALLLPTFYDSFGLVVLEAFSHGLPVISTEFLGAAYLVRQADAGTIVASPKHVVEMAAALRALPAANSAAAGAMSARAKAASAVMLPDAYLEKLVALYQTVKAETIAKHLGRDGQDGRIDRGRK
jgi:UDP-glucose:(heptosyl)LPS alpha-1,3-glucosyltransferase